MTRRTACLFIAPAVIAGVFLLAYLTLLMFPSAEIIRLSSRLAERHGLSLRIAGISKALPLGIRANGVAISCKQGVLLVLDRLSLRLRFLPLMTGRVIIAFEGSTAQGTLSGDIEATGQGGVDIGWNGVRLEELPFLQRVTSSRISGTMAGKAKVLGRGTRSSGTVRFSVDELEVAGARIGSVRLPDIARQTVQAVVAVGSGAIRLENVTVQGNDLYARLRGEIRPTGATAEAAVNLSLELMPKPDFMERQKAVFLVLGRYADSPGHYLLPIGGTVARPELR